MGHINMSFSKEIDMPMCQFGEVDLLDWRIGIFLFVVSQIFYSYGFAFTLRERAFFDQLEFGCN